MSATDHPLDPADDVLLRGPLAPPASGEDGEHTRRLERLTDGVRRLKAGSGTLKLNERILMVLGGIIAPLGLILVLIGWNGAAHTPNLFEQIPYLISGGLFGLALVFLGAFFYFTHWVTELVKEHRTQSTAVIEAITRLERAMATTGPPVRSANGAAPWGGGDEIDLVATEKGTMAHRPDCVVVSGKAGLRSVTAAEGLAPCKLCDPYGAVVT